MHKPKRAGHKAAVFITAAVAPFWHFTLFVFLLIFFKGGQSIVALCIFLHILTATISRRRIFPVLAAFGNFPVFSFFGNILFQGNGIKAPLAEGIAA